jgi:hypothetical protein
LHAAFEDVGRFASYGCQMRALHLPPWATPPCHLLGDVDTVLARGDDGVRGDYVAVVFLKKMRALGISKWHPDPVAAIEAAKRDAAA